MQQPSLDELLKKVNSKYALAVIAAKRARTLKEGDFESLYPKGTKPVTIALQEIVNGKITFEWGKRKSESAR
ncbi:MAG: DNA-directed polymerase subunit omega [Clostridia bacterium]|nr:DNA-directed polymerase subunit omega [Clostridia bacterium]